MNSPLKWHGGKHFLASRLVAMMPPHVHYVEPFAGGLSVLLEKDPRGVSEVVNDANRELTNFWRVLQVPDLFAKFVRIAQATPFSEAEFQWACRQPDRVDDDPALAAHAFFIRCRQSLAGRMKSFSGVTKTRTRGGMNGEVDAWLAAVDGLPVIHARLKRVLILNRDAVDVIRGQDSPGTLFYCDPPYVHATRATTADYAHEMDDVAHHELLSALAGIDGKFLLSGYRCPQYDAAASAHGWHRIDFDLANHAAAGASKRRMTESVWTNFYPRELDPDLF